MAKGTKKGVGTPMSWPPTPSTLCYFNADVFDLYPFASGLRNLLTDNVKVFGQQGVEFFFVLKDVFEEVEGGCFEF